MADKSETPGVSSRLNEQERARVQHIGSEFEAGIELLSNVGPAVSIFGSARSKESDSEYESARALARLLSAEGVAVITGGGPGVMEAANRGASSERGASICLNIELPHDQLSNPYLDIDIGFRYFFTRKFFLIRYARGFAILPGGFGTVDELFELLTLMQTGKIQRRPIVLIGSAYWQSLHQWMFDELVRREFVHASDMDFVSIVDDIKSAAQILLEAVSQPTRV